MYIDIKKNPLPQRPYRPTIRENKWAETDEGREGNNEISMMDTRNAIRLIIYPCIAFCHEYDSIDRFFREVLHYRPSLSPAVTRALLPLRAAQSEVTCSVIAYSCTLCWSVSWKLANFWVLSQWEDKAEIVFKAFPTIPLC